MQHYYRYYNMTRNRPQFKKIVVIIFCICFFSYIFIDYNLKTKITQLRDRFDFMVRIDAEYNLTHAYFVDTIGCRIPYFPVTDDDIVRFMSKPEKFTCKKPLTRTSDIGATIHFTMDEEELKRTYNVTDLSRVQCHYTEVKRINDDDNAYDRSVTFKLPTKSLMNSSINVEKGFEIINFKCSEGYRTFYEDVHFFIVNKFKEKQKNLINNNKVAKIIKATKKSMHKHNKNKNTNNNTEPINHKSQKNHWSNQYTSTASKSSTSTMFSSTSLNSKSAKTEPPVQKRLSVMVLGIDSLSHLNFLRQMLRSANYIHKNLTHVEFWGYNKVADNTFPNLVPVLTGLNGSELKISCLEPSEDFNFDRCTFIWKHFKEAGYQTAYAEDVAQWGLFNLDEPGFGAQPTDYYLRPTMLEMENSIGYMKRTSVKLCMGGRRTADVLMEFIRKLIPYLRIQDFFSFLWSVTLTHDDINTPILLDPDLMHIFELFDEMGIFNKTVVFLMSDHGIRFGPFRKTYQGMIEERHPLFIALYPKWMLHKYAKAIKNLELNAKRLTTHYDLHATMLDLFDLQRIQDDALKIREANLAEAESLPRGISLFLPIPETRTCEAAGIASHWCMCHRREELPTNDERVQRAARYIIKLINERLKAHPQCRRLYLNSIFAAIIAAPRHIIVKNVTNDYSIDITVRIQAKPGFGLFEGTVRMSSYTIGLTGTLSRINLYKSQSYCIDEKPLKMFCYCQR